MIGAACDAVHPRGSATIASTVAANPSGVHTGFEPQAIPFSTSVSYVTNVAPPPTTPVPPGETANVPEPLTGTPSATGLDGDVAPPVSTPPFVCLSGLGVAFGATAGFGIVRAGSGDLLAVV